MEMHTESVHVCVCCNVIVTHLYFDRKFFACFFGFCLFVCIWFSLVWFSLVSLGLGF